VNADGFGVGWYADGDPVPARYRRAVPIWGDQSLPDLARVTRSAAMLAAVRSATPGTELGESAVAPFASGSWLFSHNGVLNGWALPALGGRPPGAPPQGGLRALLTPAGEPPAPLQRLLMTVNPLSLEALVDSAFLWALVLERLRAGDAPDIALAATIGSVEAVGGSRGFKLLLPRRRAVGGHPPRGQAVEPAGRGGRGRGARGTA